jgi:hypothetical protein
LALAGRQSDLPWRIDTSLIPTMRGNNPIDPPESAFAWQARGRFRSTDRNRNVNFNA